MITITVTSHYSHRCIPPMKITTERALLYSSAPFYKGISDILGRLGPGQLGPWTLGPGTVGPQGPTVRGPTVQGPNCPETNFLPLKMDNWAPGQSGPGQFGRGARLSRAQFAKNWMICVLFCCILQIDFDKDLYACFFWYFANFLVLPVFSLNNDTWLAVVTPNMVNLNVNSSQQLRK